MGKNVTFITALALALSLGTLAAGCRSHRHVQTDIDVQERDTSSSLVVRQSQSLSSTVTSSTRTSDRSSWRITWNFDTSLPADPETHLPPVASIEAEGEVQAQEEHASTDDVAVEAEDYQAEESGVREVDVKSTELGDTEAGDGLGHLMDGLIPGILLIIALFFVARDICKVSRHVGKDSSV